VDVVFAHCCLMCFPTGDGFLMLALSAIATLVSVICFPLAFLTLLYPHVASRFGRWRGFLLYLGLSLGTLLLAAWSAPDSETSLADWTWIDWSVASVLGGGAGGYLVWNYRRKLLQAKQIRASRTDPQKSRTRKKRPRPSNSS
jgi:hypothetical protein